MNTMVLGRTGLTISRTGFGCLPIQRVTAREAGLLLNRAVDAGVTFFDTARAYSDSEEKIGLALSQRRREIVIATKTHAQEAKTFRQHLEASLRLLKTDYIDIYQFHNPAFVPAPGGADGLYDAAIKARAEGKIRFIGITQHSVDNAERAADSGLYDTLQYPFNHLATARDEALAQQCAKNKVGFIAMKALSGGLITNARTAFAYLAQWENVVPIWGVQRMHELEELLMLSETGAPLDTETLEAIARDRRELAGSFCRGCGYCMPCPQGIQINNANRMKQLLNRAVYQDFITPQWQREMARIDDCTACGYCATHCPYGLKPFETLPGQLAYYRQFVKEHTKE